MKAIFTNPSMQNIMDKPLLQYNIEVLKNQGITDIAIARTIDYDKIQEYFGSGTDFSLSIDYFDMTDSLQSIFKMLDGLYIQEIDTSTILDEDFLLIDTPLLFDIDIDHLINFHKNKDSLLTVVSRPMNSYHGKTLINTKFLPHEEVLSGKDTFQIKNFIFNPQKDYYRNLCDTGLYLVNIDLVRKLRKALNDKEINDSKLDFKEDFLNLSLKYNRTFTLETSEYAFLYSPESLSLMESALKANLPHLMNHKNSQKCIFIDEDGRIKKNVTNISKGSFEIFLDMGESLKILNEKGYLIIALTDESYLTDSLSLNEIRKFYNKFDTSLEESSSYINALYASKKGKDSIIKEAQKDFNIDLKESFLLVDSSSDINQDTKLKIKKSVQLDENYTLFDFVKDYILLDGAEN